MLTLAAGCASLPLAVLARQAAGSALIFYAALTLLVLVLGCVGFVVARYQPRNPMGWLLLGSGLSFALAIDVSSYATLAYRLHPGRLPLGWVAVLLQSSWAPAFIFLSTAVLLFPDGRLLSWHWRWPLRLYLAVSAVWAGGAVVILVTAVAGHRVRIDSSGDLAIIDHPAGAAALWGAITGVWFVVLVVCLVAAVVQQAAGYRQASGVRRQQLKWLASGAAVAVICGLSGTVLNNAPGAWQVASDVLVAGIAALPASMGVAILRYRLYDIDRIISRTLAYAIVTGLLAGCTPGWCCWRPRCSGSVLRWRWPLPRLRRRRYSTRCGGGCRRAVDRQFNRARYDADQTAAAFAARLQDAVDLDSVRDDLAGVVHRALEPAHISVWISQRD